MNCGSWLEIKNLGRFGLKIAMYLIFMKCGTQDKLNMLIINILTGIDDLDPKLQICKMWSPNWNVLQFLWNLALRTNWTCQLWIWYLELMILTQNYRFGQICSQHWKLLQFLWNLALTTNWTRLLWMQYSKYLERSHDHRLRMIVGSEHGTIIS